jgi:hypothetical protein
MKKQSEQQLQKAIKDYLILNGWMVKKINTAGIYNQKTGKYIPSTSRGMTDLICLKDGIVTFCEIKLPGRKLSEAQLAFGNEVMAHRGHHFTLSSIDNAIEMNKFVDRCNY